MKRSKEIYDDIVTVELQLQQFEDLCREKGFKSGVDYTIKIIEPKDYPYQDCPEWAKQKKIADKAYKDLKKIEFNIRNK